MERLNTTNTRGFSLVELLCVVAIIALLAGLSAGAFGGFARSFAITQSADDLKNLILLARQDAITRNSPVEVRFCRKTASDPVLYVQSILRPPDGSLRALSRPLKVNEKVVVDMDTTRSTLFAQTNAVSGSTGFAANTSTISLPDFAGTAYQVFSISFRSDGTTSLPWNLGTNSLPGKQPAFPSVTLRDSRTTNNPPANFATLLLDPASGKPTVIRP